MSRTTAAALVAGLLFGLGLAISGMTDRHVVLGFFDVAGDFDPTLAFVLAGAVLVTAVAFRFVLRQPQPLFEKEFRLPRASQVDRRLLLGAGVFGVGWGLAGFCPGPALAGLAGGVRDALVFVPAMLAGAWVHRRFEKAGAPV